MASSTLTATVRPASDHVTIGAPDNRRLYAQHGVTVAGEIRQPDGPSLWPMWREARA